MTCSANFIFRHELFLTDHFNQLKTFSHYWQYSNNLMFGQVSAFWVEKREELGNLRNIFAHDGWPYHLLLVSRNTSMIMM